MIVGSMVEGLIYCIDCKIPRNGVDRCVLTEKDIRADSTCDECGGNLIEIASNEE